MLITEVAWVCSQVQGQQIGGPSLLTVFLTDSDVRLVAVLCEQTTACMIKLYSVSEICPRFLTVERLPQSTGGTPTFNPGTLPR